MPTETEFSFSALPSPAKRHIRVFQIHQFLDRFAMGLTVAVALLALTDRGISLFEISLLFGIYSLTTLVMELPFGGLADSIGRKPVFLAAVAASLISIALFVSTSEFYILAISFGFIGFGRALRSGTLDAWFFETLSAIAPNLDAQPALAKVQWANAIGLAIGAIFGGVLPDIFGPITKGIGFSVYDVSYLVSFCVMLCVFGFTMFVIVETPRSLNTAAITTGFANAPLVIRDALILAAKHPTLPLILAMLAFFLMATNPVETLWPTHAKPMLDTSYATTVIGAVTAFYFFAIAFGASISVYINRIFKRQHAMTLASTFTCLAAIQIVLAIQGSIYGFVIMFFVYSVLIGVCETPASSLLHRCVEDRQRSTILSLKSLIQQLGAAFGLLLAGTIAEFYSTPIAWMVGAIFLIVAAILSFILAKQLIEAAKN